MNCWAADESRRPAVSQILTACRTGGCQRLAWQRFTGLPRRSWANAVAAENLSERM